MTPLRQNALTLLSGVPEEKLALVIEFLRGVADSPQRHDDAETALSKRAAFARLERMIKAVPNLDYDKALADYREERYGSARID